MLFRSRHRPLRVLLFRLLGIDDEQADAAQELCVCPEAISEFGGVACANYVSGRLETATPATRAEWMKKFDEHCAGKCGDCWNQVLFQRPTCTDPDDDCANQDCKDCCHPTPDGAGKCAEGPA